MEQSKNLKWAVEAKKLIESIDPFHSVELSWNEKDTSEVLLDLEYNLDKKHYFLGEITFSKNYEYPKFDLYRKKWTQINFTIKECVKAALEFIEPEED